MKNKIVMFSLLSLFLSISSLNADNSQVRADDAKWADIRIEKNIIQDLADCFDPKNQRELSEIIARLKVSLIQSIENGNLINNKAEKNFENIVNIFGEQIKKYAVWPGYKDRFLFTVQSTKEENNTLGRFVFEFYKLVQDDLDKEALKKLEDNIRIKYALRDRGYSREFFLKNTVDKEKKDGKKYYFNFAELFGGIGIAGKFGLGYVDKRSWGRYLRNKILGAALVGGTAAATYYGSKTQKGQELTRRLKESDYYKKAANFADRASQYFSGAAYHGKTYWNNWRNRHMQSEMDEDLQRIKDSDERRSKRKEDQKVDSDLDNQGKIDTANQLNVGTDKGRSALDEEVVNLPADEGDNMQLEIDRGIDREDGQEVDSDLDNQEKIDTANQFNGGTDKGGSTLDKEGVNLPADEGDNMQSDERRLKIENGQEVDSDLDNQEKIDTANQFNGGTEKGRSTLDKEGVNLPADEGDNIQSEIDREDGQEDGQAVGSNFGMEDEINTYMDRKEEERKEEERKEEERKEEERKNNRLMEEEMYEELQRIKDSDERRSKRRNEMKREYKNAVQKNDKRRNESLAQYGKDFYEQQEESAKKRNDYLKRSEEKGAFDTPWFSNFMRYLR